MSDTPATDAAQVGTGRVSVDFARKLERERDDAVLRREETVMQLSLSSRRLATQILPCVRSLWSGKNNQTTGKKLPTREAKKSLIWLEKFLAWSG
jgi:hypothetical protein